MTTKNVTLPLNQADLKAFFENKETVFNVKYSESALKGKMFLVYLSNLELKIEIDLSDTPVEEKLSLVREYFNLSHIIQSQTLINISMQILFYVKQSHIQLSDPLSDQEVEQFVAENQELISKWVHFLDSSLLYIQLCFNDLEDVVDFEGIEEIDDILYVGQNVVHLYGQPSFMTNYFSGLPPIRISNFKRQFNEYMFKGANLFKFFSHENNEMVCLLQGLLSEEVPVETFIESMEQAEEFIRQVENQR